MAKKDNTNLFLALALAYFLFRPGQGAQQQGTGQTLPQEPAKTSKEWVQWVQFIVALAGGLLPKLFGKGGPFEGKPKDKIVAAAFANINLYANPNAVTPINLNQDFWFKNTPFFNSNNSYYSVYQSYIPFGGTGFFP